MSKNIPFRSFKKRINLGQRLFYNSPIKFLNLDSGGSIPITSRLLDETDLQNALKLDFEQLKTDANTPDRGYSVPIDNVKKLIDTYHK